MRRWTWVATVVVSACVYEDLYVKTKEGWRIQSRTHVSNKAWHNPLLQTADLN